ncbi:hypothetical protein D9611_005755 [Ephemerocybe angulata]|uniref:Mid2 domain-containing protein n=1 Tax=Ephemerocybe angulata TaxID=980116 RepID=A0A8H5BJ83_9AGAR|nr:hypothetical protein D9611_005755 [Tulosesus angulatus]
MLALNTRKLSTTLFISLAVLVAVSTVVEASHDAPLQQRDHVNLKRILKKRATTFPGDGSSGPVIGAAPIPGAGSSSTTDPLSTGTSTTATTATTPGGITIGLPLGTTETTGTTSGTTSGTASLPTDSTSTTSTTSGTTTSGTTSTTSTTTSTTSTTTTPPAAPTDNNVTSTSTDKVRSTKTVVTSVEASSTTVPQLSGAAAQKSSNIMTILVAIAASLGGVAILWTVFRKWKLGSSKRFEERLQPIDWKSPSHDDGLPASHPRRNSGSSFNSGRSRGNGLSPLEHDFTAGPSGVSPVGGYADMSRGPSPTMRENHFNGTGGRY